MHACKDARNNNTESLLLAVLFSRSARAEKKDETKMFKNLSLFLGISFFFVPLGFRVKKEKVPSVFFSFFWSFSLFGYLSILCPQMDDGSTIRLRLTIDREKGSAELDFSGTTPQVSSRRD